MELTELIKKFQQEMNSHGENLTVDGDFGPKTAAAADKFKISIFLTSNEVEKIEIPNLNARFQAAPWVFNLVPLIGMNESQKALNDILAPHWAKVGLPEFKDLKGSVHAWCSLGADWAMRKSIIQGTGNALAVSWKSWGVQCEYWFGAVLPIRHASGRWHVTFFLYWIDEHKKIAACLGCNQGDEVNISAYNLSGNELGHDEVINGPRWPSRYSPGAFIPADDVRALISSLPKMAGSTR